MFVRVMFCYCCPHNSIASHKGSATTSASDLEFEVRSLSGMLCKGKLGMVLEAQAEVAPPAAATATLETAANRYQHNRPARSTVVVMPVN